ncbi:MAG: YkvA family protein [Pseudomonadota bacterium]
MAVQSPIRIEFELDDQDIEYFRNRLMEAKARHGSDSEAQIIEAAESLLMRSADGKVPHFLKSRMDQLGTMIAMLKDEDWRLEGDDRAFVVNALVYFAEPHDMIPDDIPGIGFLDDAIMIDLAAGELAPELIAYAEFCDNRDELKDGVADAQPLEAARDILQDRMRRQRRRAVRRGRSGGRSYSLFGSI